MKNAFPAIVGFQLHPSEASIQLLRVKNKNQTNATTMNVLFFFISDETNKSKTFFPIFLHRRRKKREINAIRIVRYVVNWFDSPLGDFFTFLMKRRFAWNDYFPLWLKRPQGLRNIIDTVFIYNCQYWALTIGLRA